MQLRMRSRRGGLRLSYVCLITVFVIVVFAWMRRARRASPRSIDASYANGLMELEKEYPVSFASTLSTALLSFAETEEEIATLNSINADDLKAFFEKLLKDPNETIRLSLITKATAGASRQALIKELEPQDATRRNLYSILARKLDDEAPSQISDGNILFGIPNRFPLSEDVIAQTLSGLSESRRDIIAKQMSMDDEEKWRDIPKTNLKHLERGGSTPLNRNCTKIFVPDHEGKYGGLTADCGWILVSGMLALESGECLEFPRKWGHGCDDESIEPTWTCFFKPVQWQDDLGGVDERRVASLQVEKLRSAVSDHRKRARRDFAYMVDFQGHRYPRLEKLISEANALNDDPITTFDLPWNADLLAFRLVFRWIFRPNDRVRAKLDEMEIKLLRGFKPEEIAGAHLRFGDKVGLRPGPREANMLYEVKDFAQRLALYYSKKKLPFPKAIFVATDDFNSSVALGKLLGPSVTILTSAEPKRDQGFSIIEYREQWTAKSKFDAAVRLWADMEILSRTQVALLSFQSNIGRTVTLMRFGKSADSTISVDPTARCSKEARSDQLRSHNFWLCP